MHLKLPSPELLSFDNPKSCGQGLTVPSSPPPPANLQRRSGSCSDSWRAGSGRRILCRVHRRSPSAAPDPGMGLWGGAGEGQEGGVEGESSPSLSRCRHLYSCSRQLSSSMVAMWQPGRAWKNALTSPHRLAWLLDLYRALRHASATSANPDWMGAALPVVVRQVAVQLCSLSGPVFGAGGGGSARWRLLCAHS